MSGRGIALAALSFLFVTALFLVLRDSIDTHTTSIQPVAIVNGSGELYESYDVILPEPRPLSRLELLRKFSDDFYGISFREDPSVPVFSDVWIVVSDLGWTQSGSLIEAESFVPGKDFYALLSLVWGGDIPVPKDVVTDTLYDELYHAVMVNRNSMPLTKGRALEAALRDIKGYDYSSFDMVDFEFDSLPYETLSLDYYVPYLNAAYRANWLPLSWRESFKPQDVATQADTLELLFAVLGVDGGDTVDDRAAFALERGLILRTELGAYRLRKSTTYGAFRRLLVEAERVLRF